MRIPRDEADFQAWPAPPQARLTHTLVLKYPPVTSLHNPPTVHPSHVLSPHLGLLGWPYRPTDGMEGSRICLSCLDGRIRPVASILSVGRMYVYILVMSCPTKLLYVSVPQSVFLTRIVFESSSICFSS